MTEDSLYDMYRLLALAKYEDRYVIPEAHSEMDAGLEELECSLDFAGGPGLYDEGVFGEASGRPTPVAVETFQALKQRQESETIVPTDDRERRVNLLNWDGAGVPLGMPLMPPKKPEENA